MRLFIAIELPAPVRGHLVDVQESLRALLGKASYTREENLHLTLKFLGEASTRQVDELVESLTLVRGGGGAIQLFAERIECFPERGPARIAAAGFGGASAGLTGLHRTIEQKCRYLGFDRETRAYRAHVTLARARPTWPGSIRDALSDAIAASFPGPPLDVTSFNLMESRLSPKGSEYRIVQQFLL